MTRSGRWDGGAPPPSRGAGPAPRDARSRGTRPRGPSPDDRAATDRAATDRAPDAERAWRGVDRERVAVAAGDGGDTARAGERPRVGGHGRGVTRDHERSPRDERGGQRPSRGPVPRPRALPRPPRWRTWSVYLVPLLVVITVLAVVQTVRAEDGVDGGDSSDAAGSPTAPPVVGEAPRSSVDDVDIPTADLPPGGAFPVRGRQTWHIVPGTTPQVGTGQVFTYTVEVEDGAALPEGDAAFATAVDATLSDPRSWIGSGQIAMRRVDATTPEEPDFRISLTSQLTIRDQCGYTLRYEASCWKSDSGRVLINGARWVRGAAAFDGQLGLYRQYAINHEVGHVFRNQHAYCPEPGGLAPVMMQQSFGTSNDYLAQLTEENPQGTQIPRDGKTCQPNPWPYPEGAVAPAG